MPGGRSLVERLVEWLSNAGMLLLNRTPLVEPAPRILIPVNQRVNNRLSDLVNNVSHPEFATSKITCSGLLLPLSSLKAICLQITHYSPHGKEKS